MAIPSYFAAGANRQTAAADWAPDGTLVYGAGVNLAVWRPADEAGICCLLSGHADTVKAVQAVGAATSPTKTYFVSGGDDKTLKLWAIARDRATNRTTGRCIQTVDDAHGAPVNCIAVERQRHASASTSARRLLATGGADYAITIWALDYTDTEPRLSRLQTITTTPRYFPLCLALVSLTGASNTPNAWLLAAAGTSNRIQIFAGSETPPAQDVRFSLEATLSGHEGWVRSLDFAWEDTSGGPHSDLLLASASQDKYVRLWRVHRGASMPAPSASAAAAASLLGEDGLLPTLSSSASPSSPSNKAHRLRVAAEDYSVTFEALLFGHEDWIYSAKWDVSVMTDTPDTIDTKRSARLLTTSADNSLAVWEADTGSGIWVTTARLGELSKEKGATTATGSVGGFWVGLWGVGATTGPCSSEVAVLCRTGSWRRWVWAAPPDAPEGRWVQAVGVSGHVKPVTGIAWSRDGAYLLSTSSDQTTRLHAAWSRPSSASKSGSCSTSWHEMARPQIHGYDLNCIDALGPTQFVSGADEKLMRVFHEPKSVARLLAELGVTGVRSLSDLDVLPDAANMPVLGLSNKAVDDDEGAEAAQSVEADATTTVLSDAPTVHPPFEDTLARSTLWPETEKLYGHGYEISSLAVSHDGTLVASACRASSLNHAVVRLFETTRWTEVRPPLATHSLTVTRLRFSDDDTFLLSVGRDRQWATFQRRDGGSGSSSSSYSVYETNSKAHARMILDCAWAPSSAAGRDGEAKTKRRVFATAGRDKNVKVWAAAAAAAKGGDEHSTDTFALATTIAQDHPVTAVDFLWRTAAAPAGAAGAAAPFFLLGIGTEAGRLSVVSLDAATLAVSAVLIVDAGLCLPKAVLQLAWRPRQANAIEAQGTAADETAADLAVAGDDASLRVYSVKL